MSKVHLIYYDENIDFNSENYGYVKKFKNTIQGAFFPVKTIDSLKKLVEKLKSITIKGAFTLVTSGRAAEKVIPICSSIINNIIIFCFYIDKYLPLKVKFPKIKQVLADFQSIFKYLSDSQITNDTVIINNKFITFEDYSNKYINFHKILAKFFNEKYNNISYDSSNKKKFLDFVDSIKDVEGKNMIRLFVEKVEYGTVKEFIEAYTGETTLCYSLNRWLRNLNEYEYNGLQYFAGPFSYALYKYAYDRKNQGIYYTKKFYRKMTIKLSDFYMYKIFIGELICYPAFTSTSEKDISKYNFPTATAIEVNKLTANDISVVLIIEYICYNKNDSTPCINASEYSVNSGEEEYIFPPFSFFKITNVEERDGKPNNPHIIYMSIPSKSNLVEFWLKQNRTINYNSKENRLYSS